MVSLLFSGLGLVFLALVVYAIAMAYQKHHTLAAPPDPEYGKLEQHVSKLSDSGLAAEDIRNKLIAAGWQPEKVDLVLHDIHNPDGSVEKLMFYVQDQIRRQKPKDEIRQQLLAARWDEKLV